MTALAATRIFTDDVDALITFYERITGLTANRLHPLFGEITTPRGTLAIASTDTVPLLGPGCAHAGANRSVCLDFLVDDVDALLPALREEFATEPLRIDVGAEHTYGVDWARDSLVFHVDGHVVRELTQAPDYPVQLMLGVFAFPDRHRELGPDRTEPELVVSRVQVLDGSRPLE